MHAEIAQAPASLATLLNANLGLPPEYRDGMSNHLPMALQALHSMGASGERMQAFYSHYAQRFEGLGPGDEAYTDLLAHCTQLVAEQGRSEALRQALPDLLPGLTGAAFHGAIRTAHAVESGHDGELAAGLAYWAWRRQPLAPPPAAAELLSFEVWAERLVREASAWHSPAPSISLRMVAATQAPVYRALGAALEPQADLLRKLAGLALDRYLASRNFTVLHMVTGLRALRVLLPWVDGSASLQPLLVRAFTAAYLAAQMKPMAQRDAQPLPNWHEVIVAAIASNDDHTIKLVHACREEAVAYGDPRYLEAAALAVS